MVPMDKKKWLTTNILVSVAFIFTIFVFAPFELFFNNQNEFWFDLQSILIPFLGMATIGFIALQIMYTLLPSIGKRVLVGLVFAGVLGMYLQCNILNPQYGTLGAEEMRWEAFEVHTKYNTLMWIVWILGIVIAAGISKKQFPKVATVISAAIIAMQGIALICLVGINMTSQREVMGDGNTVLSAEGIYELGDAEGSVVIFLTDTTDNLYFDNAIEDTPEYYSTFDGFTRFRNCVSTYSMTAGSVPYILTGEYYKNIEIREEFLDEAYAESELLNQFRKNNYDIRVFSGDSVLPDVLGKYVNNGKIEELNLVNNKPVVLAMLKLVLFRYAPEHFKKAFYITSSDFSALEEECAIGDKYVIKDDAFYSDLVSEGMSVIHGQKTFRFIHLTGSHAPFYLTREAKWDDQGTNSLEQTLGVLKIIDTYFALMKENDVYDNTTIIVMADHSRFRDGDSIMMVKPPYAHGTMQENNCEVSHRDIHNTIFALTGLNKVDYGKNMFDVEKGEDREQCHLVKQMAEEEYPREKMIYRKESHLLFFAVRQKDRWTSASK